MIANSNLQLSIEELETLDPPGQCGVVHPRRRRTIIAGIAAT
ncbi:hypothetical protein [Arthrobacter sp. M2012083]|nr:hypothetical protein [Arthrobacter sp. M2012083]